MPDNYRTMSPNYTQRNNLTNPERACNVSAVCSALRAAGYQLPPGPTSQDDENFMRFIRGSKECLLLTEKLNRDWKTIDTSEEVPPEQCHAVLDFAANQWLGKRIACTIQKASAQMIMNHMDNGGTCFASGKFPTTNGHYVAIVDYYKPAGAFNPDYWVIKDPWGDCNTGYKSHYGNNVQLKWADYLHWMRKADEEMKMMHFIARTI